jgi:hypothetical protein
MLMKEILIDNAEYHDNTIHSIEFIDENYESDLVLGIDYISEWINSDDGFKFKISPASLIFKNVSDIDIRITRPGYTQESYINVILDLDIAQYDKEINIYTIKLLDESYIKFKASRSELIAKEKYYIKSTQSLTVSERSNA